VNGTYTMWIFEIAPDFGSVLLMRTCRLEGHQKATLIRRGKALLFVNGSKLSIADALGGPQEAAGDVPYGTNDNMHVDQRVEDYVAFTGGLSNSMGDDEEDTDEGGHVFCISRRVFGSFFDGAETFLLWRNGAVMVHYDHRIRNFHTGRVERRWGRTVVADPTSGLIIATENERTGKRVLTAENGAALFEIPDSEKEQISFGNVLVKTKAGPFVHYVFE